MKKLLAMLLAVACVVCLFAGCGNTNPTTTQKPTPSTPVTPAPTDPKPTDPKPTDPAIPTLPGAPVAGDKVHIYLPDKGLALGYNPDAAKPQRMEAVNGTVTDGVLTAEGAGVFDVVLNQDGTYYFVCGGKYLTTGETGKVNKIATKYTLKAAN